ncbi:MAG: DUF362 domain-containing protein, partial [Nitrospinota bacterium]|nr:DUF362 domain-containing protein [Nitrospinota bacterium]
HVQDGKPVGKFWLSLTFSMMMTITALCYFVQRNPRKNRSYAVPLMISKSASALSALFFYLFAAEVEKYFAYIVIFIVDGSLFWMTLFFYLRTYKAWFESQITIFRKEAKDPKITPPTTVIALKGDDKFKLLEDVVKQTGFIDVLNDHFKKSGKTDKNNFSVVIKPNFMFLHHIKDYSTYTDPELVEALVDKIHYEGYTNITIVEAQSTLGNYFNNRDVLSVAKYVGYSENKNYKIVDLTKTMVEYDYGGRLGKHCVGPAWRDADFRISFAKNKTHVFCNYTLTLKNIYGTLPMQNKLKEYHTKREYDWPTIESMKHFWVHFGFIDAFSSADGQFGVIVDPKPNHTKTIIGGENLIAVDWVGAKKMGLDPDDPNVGRFLPLAVEAFGKPEEIKWVGDKSVYQPWENVSEVFIRSLDLLEEAYHFSNFFFSGVAAMDKHFSYKVTALPNLLLRKFLIPFKKIFYKYDHLG